MRVADVEQFLAEEIGEFDVAEREKVLFEGEGAVLTPAVIGERLHEFYFLVADGLVSVDAVLTVAAVGFRVFAGEQNGAAGEPGFQSIKDERLLPSSVRGPVES